MERSQMSQIVWKEIFAYRARAGVVYTDIDALMRRVMTEVLGPKEVGAWWEYDCFMRDNPMTMCREYVFTMGRRGGVHLRSDLELTPAFMMRCAPMSGQHLIVDAVEETVRALAWRFYRPKFRIGR